MLHFHGAHKRRNYFEGWYFKNQNGADTLALIPAFHADGNGQPSASLQVITDNGVYHADFPASAFYADQKRLFIRLGDCTFSREGCRLRLHTKAFSLEGALSFGPFVPPAYGIMGRFSFVPFMECRHSVFSLRHRVDGEVTLNGRRFLFQGGQGYLEGDRGVSFPRRYLWTQCSFEEGSLMLSVADIPFLGLHFTGSIGFIYMNGKERRIATYLGARARAGKEGALVRQGKLCFQVNPLCSGGHLLKAPRSRGMTRHIHESAACRVRYRCWEGNKPLFDFISDQASFENNWGNEEEHILL